MRITNNMLMNNMLTNMNGNLTRMSKYQNQMATGKKIQLPSDDPIIASRALKLRTDVAEVEQYQRNVNDATSWMELSESAIGQLGDMFQRVRELMVQASNSSNTADDLDKINEEIDQYKSQITQIANTTYAGRYIFSGYKTDKPLMDQNGNFLVDVNMDEDIEYEISIGDDININVPAGDLFNMGANATNGTQGSMIQFFNNLSTALTSADVNTISNMLNDVDDQIDNMLRVRSSIGARMNRLELTGNRLEADNYNFTKLLANNEDADMAEVIMNLQSEENVYKASLAGGAKIIQPTLADFLS